MKTAIYLILFSTLLFSCQSYEDYTCEYGTPKSPTTFIDENIDEWTDDPGKLLIDVTPFGIYNPSDSTELGKYKNIRAIEIKEFNERFYSTINELILNPSFYYNKYINNYNYRNKINWNAINFGLNTSFYVILTHNMLPEFSPSSQINNNYICNAMVKGKKVNYNTKWAEISIYGRKVTLIEGNKRLGLVHIRNRHYPISYIEANRQCSKYTNLFLLSEDEITINLFKQLEHTKLFKIKSNNPNRIAFEGRVTCPNGQSRWYDVVINENNEVISFFPSSRIQKIYLNEKYSQYNKVKNK